MTELSVVLISKDQEWNIARLIESVLKETEDLLCKEVVLVDSASTDQTTEIAARYPILVLKLCPEQRLTAAAGRYIGYKHTKGNLVLFLDGDMELCEGWLHQALQVMDSNPAAAVVTGKVLDQPKSIQKASPGLLQTLPVETVGLVEVLHGGGAAMYRRSVLEEVGTFNPYLYADEEPELCLRIRYAGYRVLQLLRPIAFHYSDPHHNFSTLLNKRRHNYFLGYGQNTRNFFGTPLLKPYLKERGWAIPPLIMFCLGIFAAAISWITGHWIWLLLWTVSLFALTFGIALRKRSLQRGFLILFLRLLILEGTIHGFMLKPQQPASYPGKFDLVQSLTTFPIKERC